MAIVAGPTRWQETTRIPTTALGTSIAGGRLICKSGGVAWIAAPNTTEVSRSWYERNDAVTTAQQVTGLTEWFVPTLSQLQNPGYVCKIYWDHSGGDYWSSTECNSGYAFFLNLFNGAGGGASKNNRPCVRAFRCVTY